MAKKVAILIEEMYNEHEFWYPYYRFLEAGCEVTVVGTGRSQVYHSKAGLPAKERVAADQVDPDTFDAVIIPGGFAPDFMRRNKEMVNLVKAVFAKGGIVAAICHAGWMLASADILRGKKATCYFAIKDDIVNAGAQYVDEPVVVDGNLITSRVPDDLPIFCKTILAELGE